MEVSWDVLKSFLTKRADASLIKVSEACLSLASIDKKFPSLINGRVPVDPNVTPYKVILNSRALSQSGNQIVDSLGPYSMVVLTVRIDGPVTGTTPTLVFTLSDMDPSSPKGTVNLTGNQVVSTAFTAIATVQTFVFVTRTGMMQLAWTVGGTTPLFGNVSATVSALSGSARAALVASAPSAVSVGIATGAAVASNPKRTGLVLTNTSASIISLGIGSPAVLYSGITLYPGGVWTMDAFTFTTAAINAIALVAASNLAIQELTT